MPKASSDDAMMELKRRQMTRCRPSDPRAWSSYRDKPGLFLAFGLVGFMVSITAVAMATGETPPLFLCRHRNLDRCRRVEERGGVNVTVVYYDFAPRRQKGPEAELCKQFNVNGVPFPTYQETQKTDNVTFAIAAENRPPGYALRPNPDGKGGYLVTCVRSKALYHQLKEAKAVEVYAICTGVTFFVAVAVLAVLFVAPVFLLELVHLTTQLTLWVGLFYSAATSLMWVVFWLLFILIHAVVYMMSRPYFADVGVLSSALKKVIVAEPGLLVQCCQTSFSSCAWFIFWAWLFSNINGQYTIAVDIIMYVFLIWMFEIIKYHNHMTISGAVASWYYNRLMDSEFPVLRSWIRASTTSLGSVTIGAFLVSLCKVFLIIASSLRNVRKGSMQGIAAVARIIASLIGVFNVYGFVHAAVYGTPYIAGCKAAQRQIYEASLHLMMVDGIISTSNMFAGIFVGFLSAGTSYMLRETVYPNELTLGANWVVLYVPTFALGMFTGIAVLDLLESMSITVYVCFAEEPFLLENVDPELFQELTDSWNDAIEADADAEFADDDAMMAGDDDDESISDFGDEEDGNGGGDANKAGSFTKRAAALAGGRSTKFLAKLKGSDDVVMGVPVTGAIAHNPAAALPSVAS